jgi:hypothetical protein
MTFSPFAKSPHVSNRPSLTPCPLALFRNAPFPCCFPIPSHGITYLGILRRMPRNNKKGKRQTAGAVAAQTANDDFDDMLAEVMAGDTTSHTTTTPATARSSNFSPSSVRTTISEEAIIECCFVGDIAKLRRWARLGARVVSAMPLCASAEQGHVNMLRILIEELGADVNKSVAPDGCFPLYIAAQNGHMAALRCLVMEFGAYVNQAMSINECRTPLHAASQNGHLAVVRCLVKELGADPNQADTNGCTPLYMAAQQGWVSVVICLVKECGADLNRAKPSGSTPLDIAAQ